MPSSLSESDHKESTMQVSIIGSGNVAHVFGLRLKERGCTIREVVGRTIEDVDELGRSLAARTEKDMSKLDGESDIYLLAVNDDAIKEVAAQLPPTQALVAHCSGSTPLQSIPHGKRAVLWPLQSIHEGAAYRWEDMNIVLESDTDLGTVEAINLIDNLGAKSVQMDKESRSRAHLVAVILNNFGNHLLHMADVLCSEKGMDRRLFQDLMLYTLSVEGQAKDHQTGPAIRGDYRIIQKHLKELEGHPTFHSIYESMSNSISQS